MVEEQPIIVRDLGLGGVNVVATPLTMGEYELAQAQNTEPYLARRIAGVRKRAAYRPLNTIALDPTKGLISVELTQGGGGPGLGPRDGGNGPEVVYVAFSRIVS